MLNLANTLEVSSILQKTMLGEIDELDRELAQHFKSKFVVQTSLTRSLDMILSNIAERLGFLGREYFSAARRQR